jgi:hypothetical protein
MGAYGVLLFMIIAISAKAQVINREKLIGEWTPITLIVSETKRTEAQMEFLEELQEGFFNSKYTIRGDGYFDITFPKNIPLMNELGFIKHAKWIYDEDEGIISIGTTEDGYSLMHIIVAEKDGKLYFVLDKLPIMLEVIKSRTEASWQEIKGVFKLEI